MADVVLSYKKADRERLKPLISAWKLAASQWWDYEIETDTNDSIGAFEQVLRRW
jgi:hypothetical protein